MTVFLNANGLKKRTIIKSLQKLKEKFAEIVSADRDVADLVASIEYAIMSGGQSNLPGKLGEIVNGNLIGDCI